MTLRYLPGFALVLCAGCAKHPVTAIKAPAQSPAQSQVERQIVNAVDAGDGDYQINILRRRLDADPKDLATRLALADRYRNLGFPDIAIEHGRLACERLPDSVEAHVALAKMLRDAGRQRDAVALLERFSQTNPASQQIWAWIGLLRDDAEDWKSGESAYRKALSLDPARDDLHNNLGYCLLRQDRKQEAAAEFREALRLDPQSTIARNNLGLALAADPAVSATEAVGHLQSVTDPASAHNNLAVGFMEAGRYPEARREIQLALSYNRQHSAALTNLVLVSRMDGKPATIEARLRTEGKWARTLAAWHRFWGSEGKTTEPGSALASR